MFIISTYYYFNSTDLLLLTQIIKLLKKLNSKECQSYFRHIGALQDVQVYLAHIH